MPLKCVMVLLDSSPGSTSRVHFAAKLCARHDAHLIGLYITSSHWTPSDSFALGHAAIKSLLDHHKGEETADFERVQNGFVGTLRGTGVSFEFRVVKESDIDQLVDLYSVQADVVIIGQTDSGGLPSFWNSEALLVWTGMPFVIVPETWDRASVGNRIVVGWNASRQARRAIVDAFPLLLTAATVSVLVVDPLANPRLGKHPGEDVAMYLGRHGLNVTVDVLQSEGRNVANTIMEFVRRNRFDLIVMGAFSHSRTWKMLFGSVTRSLMKETRVPLFVAN